MFTTFLTVTQEISKEVSTILEYHTFFLRTTWEDLFFLLLGISLMIARQWKNDQNIFEYKTKIAKKDKEQFYNLFPTLTTEWKYWSETKWNYKIWLKDHDQDFIWGIICSIVLVFSVPYVWGMVSTFPFTPIISIGLGALGSIIGDNLFKRGEIEIKRRILEEAKQYNNEN